MIGGLYIMDHSFSMSGAVSQALSTVVSDVTTMAGDAAPVVLGGVAVLVGISIGINLFKRFAYSVS